MSESASLLRAAVVQLNSQTDKAANVEAGIRGIRRAAADGAQFIVLPEYWTYLGPESGYQDAAEEIPGPTTTRICELARDLSVSIIAGSMLERDPSEVRFFNTSVLVDSDGTLLVRYRKIHLFDVDLGIELSDLESREIAPGDDVVVGSVNGHNVGLSICYDLRFPELYRRLVDLGAEVLTIPSAFHMFTGKDHWELLVRARAIENQAFVLAAAQYGRHPGGQDPSFGRSMIVDPWGTVLATVPDGGSYAVAELDFERLLQVRTQLPALTNRRLGREVRA